MAIGQTDRLNGTNALGKQKIVDSTDTDRSRLLFLCFELCSLVLQSFS